MENSDIKYYLSGASSDGGAQSDPNASLGNYRSSTQITSDAINNLFDDISAAEASAGDTEYRAVFVKNTHGTDTLSSVKLWIVSQPNARGTKEAFEIAKEEPSAQPAGYIQTIANESTAPTSVSFSAPASKGAGIDLPDLQPGYICGIWLKRVAPASTDPAADAKVEIKVEGESA